MSLHTRGQSWTQHVIARTDVQYHLSMPFREAPYVVHSWIGSVGTKSFTICAEVRDERQRARGGHGSDGDLRQGDPAVGRRWRSRSALGLEQELGSAG